jgi:ABC-type lipoprotein release transport system permease subunit
VTEPKNGCAAKHAKWGAAIIALMLAITLAAGIARLMVGALLSSGEVSMEALLIGIDPRARAAAYPALGLRAGRFFEPGEKGVLLNRNVARKLGVGVGGTVVALGATADGRISGVKLIVTGIWMVRGLDAYEWGSCYADLAAVQELLDAGDAAGVLIFRQKDERLASGPIAASVTAVLRRHGVRARAWTWEEMGGPFLGGLIVNRVVGGILHAVLGTIAALGILNTALMSVFERTREIGTIRAIGSRRSRVVSLFLLEGLFLGITGAVLGGLLGAGLVRFFSGYGIPAFSEAQRYHYGGDRLYPVLAWGDTLYYRFNTSEGAALPLRPNDLLLWEGIRMGAALGCRRLDLGRSDDDQRHRLGRHLGHRAD